MLAVRRCFEPVNAASTPIILTRTDHSRALDGAEDQRIGDFGQHGVSLNQLAPGCYSAGAVILAGRKLDCRSYSAWTPEEREDGGLLIRAAAKITAVAELPASHGPTYYGAVPVQAGQGVPIGRHAASSRRQSEGQGRT